MAITNERAKLLRYIAMSNKLKTNNKDDFIEDDDVILA